MTSNRENPALPHSSAKMNPATRSTAVQATRYLCPQGEGGCDSAILRSPDSSEPSERALAGNTQPLEPENVREPPHCNRADTDPGPTPPRGSGHP